MLELYSPQSAKKTIDRESDWICRVAEEFSVPASWIRAILLKEMTELNLMDLVADLAVRFYYLRFRLLGREPKSSGRFLGKKDSSTGWAQIYAFVAIRALNFAADRAIADYTALGFDPSHRLDEANPRDRWQVWERLNTDRRFNIAMCALNLLSCAHERTGRTDVRSFTPDEIKLTFTRYNGTVPTVTPCAESVYRYYEQYREQTAQQL